VDELSAGVVVDWCTAPSARCALEEAHHDGFTTTPFLHAPVEGAGVS